MTHASGTSTVTANQRLNGGQWNLLGTYTFNSGTSYKVELSDQVAAGKVAADAIYIAGTAAPAAAFTWTPAIPSAGTWRVLVRWPASSGNTANAQYTVTMPAAPPPSPSTRSRTAASGCRSAASASRPAPATR